MVWGGEKNFEDTLTITKDRLNSGWLIKWLSCEMLFSLSFMFIQNHERNGCNIWELFFNLKLWLIYITIFERNEGSYELFTRIYSFCWSYEVSVWFPNLIWGLQFPDESRFNIWLRPKTTRFAPSHPTQQSFQKILYLNIRSYNQGYTSTISIQKVNLWPWKVCIV